MKYNDLRKKFSCVIDDLKKQYKFLDFTDLEFEKHIKKSLACLNLSINYTDEELEEKIKILISNYFDLWFIKILKSNNFLSVSKKYFVTQLEHRSYEDYFCILTKYTKMLEEAKIDVDDIIAKKLYLNIDCLNIVSSSAFLEYNSLSIDELNKMQLSANLIFLLDYFAKQTEKEDAVITNQTLVELPSNFESISVYRRDLNDYPLLDKETTKELFVKLEKAKLLEESSGKTRQIENLRNEIISHNLRLVFVVANKRRNNGLDFNDLISEGNFGLFKAVSKYKYELGYAFSTYATIWIEQSIDRAIGNISQTIRIPVNTKRKLYNLKKFKEEFEISNGREPTKEEYIQNTNCSEEIINVFFNNNAITVSLDTKINDDSESTLGSLIAADQEDICTLILNENLKSEVINLIKNSRLSDQQKDVIYKRFGFYDGTIHTLDSIAKSYGITRERIRQLESKAISILRKGRDIDRLSVFLDNPDAGVSFIKNENYKKERKALENSNNVNAGSLKNQITENQTLRNSLKLFLQNTTSELNFELFKKLLGYEEKLYTEEELSIKYNIAPSAIKRKFSAYIGQILKKSIYLTEIDGIYYFDEKNYTKSLDSKNETNKKSSDTTDLTQKRKLPNDNGIKNSNVSAIKKRDGLKTDCEFLEAKKKENFPDGNKSNTKTAKRKSPGRLPGTVYNLFSYYDKSTVDIVLAAVKPLHEKELLERFGPDYEVVYISENRSSEFYKKNSLYIRRVLKRYLEIYAEDSNKFYELIDQENKKINKKEELIVSRANSMATSELKESLLSEISINHTLKHFDNEKREICYLLCNQFSFEKLAIMFQKSENEIAFIAKEMLLFYQSNINESLCAMINNCEAPTVKLKKLK